MNGSSDSVVDPLDLEVDPLPESLSGGSTVLIASAGDPSQYAVSLRILGSYGAIEDTAFVVTTTESVDQTIKTYTRLGTEFDQPSLRIVDTTSQQQSISDLYGETPVVFTPSPDDLERLVLALSELSGDTSPPNGERHFAVRSLTPILSAAPIDRVSTVLERITGLRSENGLGLIGIDYTAHDEATMEAVADHVDGILWVSHPSPNQITFDYQPRRGRNSQSVLGQLRDD